MKSNGVLLLYAINNSHNKNDINNYNDYNNKYKMNYTKHNTNSTNWLH